MSAIWSLMFGYLPAWVQVVFLAFLAVLVVLIVIKVIALILSAVPFL